jgi:uncharacterized protein (DUF2141 family)
VQVAFRPRFQALAASMLASSLALMPFPLQANDLKVDYSEAQQISPCLQTDDATPRVLVDVTGIETSDGQLRVQIYSDKPEDFLVSGKKVLRVDVPTHTGEQKVCVTFPAAGTYSMAVLHDKNANGRADIFSEGFGFSNNPRLLFGPPDHDQTLFAVESGVQEMTVALTYYFQLENKDQKRRKRH